MDLFGFKAGINQPATARRAWYLFGYTMIFLPIIMYDITAGAGLASMFSYPLGPGLRHVLNIGFGLLFAGALTYGIHRVVALADPQVWRDRQSTFVFYVGVVVLVQLALMVFVELIIRRGDMEHWKTDQNTALQRELVTREEVNIDGVFTPKIEAIDTATTAIAVAYVTERAAEQTKLEARRAQGAKDRGQRTALGLRTARAAGTRSSTIAAIAAANAARAQAAAGIAGATVSSQDAYEKETETLLAAYDVETGRMLEGKLRPQLEERGRLVGEMNVELGKLHAMKVQELADTYGINDPKAPDRRVYGYGPRDDFDALGAVAEETPWLRWLLAAFAVGMVLVLLLYKQMTIKHLFLAQEQRAYLDKQGELCIAVMDFFEHLRDEVRRRDPTGGHHQQRGDLNTTAANLWKAMVVPKMRELTQAELDLTQAVLDVPEWRKDLPFTDDPRRWQNKEPWRLSDEQLSEWGWVDPAPMFAEGWDARNALMGLGRYAGHEAGGIYGCVILYFGGFLDWVRNVVAANRGASGEDILETVRQQYDTMILPGGLRLGDIARTVGIVEGKVKIALGESGLPPWPFDKWPERGKLEEVRRPPEAWMREAGWEGKWKSAAKIAAPAIGTAARPLDPLVSRIGGGQFVQPPVPKIEVSADEAEPSEVSPISAESLAKMAREEAESVAPEGVEHKTVVGRPHRRSESVLREVTRATQDAADELRGTGDLPPFPPRGDRHPDIAASSPWSMAGEEVTRVTQSDSTQQIRTEFDEDTVVDRGIAPESGLASARPGPASGDPEKPN